MRDSTRQLKRQARSLLSGRHGAMAGIALLVMVLNLLLNYLASAASPYGAGLFNVILFFCIALIVNMIYYIVLAGVHRIYLNLTRGNFFKWSDIFSAFREHPEPVAIYAVLQYVLTYALSLTISGFIFSVSDFVSSRRTGSFLLNIFLLLAVLVIYIFIELSFSMVLFIYADNPWLSFREMIRQAWQLISGVRGRYLYLQVSFLGMYLLGILSFGIGFLFVKPYTRSAEALFYREISGR